MPYLKRGVIKVLLQTGLEYVVGRLEPYELLKKLFWMSRSGQLSLATVELLIIDRSSLNGEKLVKLSDSAILMKDRVVIPEDGTQIPIHRVIEIREGDECLWRRSRGARMKP